MEKYKLVIFKSFAKRSSFKIFKYQNLFCKSELPTSLHFDFWAVIKNINPVLNPCKL